MPASWSPTWSKTRGCRNPSWNASRAICFAILRSSGVRRRRLHRRSSLNSSMATIPTDASSPLTPCSRATPSSRYAPSTRTTTTPAGPGCMSPVSSMRRPWKTLFVRRSRNGRRVPLPMLRKSSRRAPSASRSSIARTRRSPRSFWGCA